MTISTSSSKVIFLGNGSSTFFQFAFPAVASSDITVTYTDANGNQTVLQPSQYTLAINAPTAGQSYGSGGSITYPISGSPIAAGTSLTVQRNLPYVQSTSLGNQGSLWPQTIEGALDYLTMLTQQLVSQYGQALVVPASDPTPTPLPAAVARAGQFMAFDSSGNPIAALSAGTVPVSSIMQPVVASATIQAARQLMGIASGVVRMFPDSLGGWHVVDPWGSPINTTGTQTNGLQEAINYGVANGYAVEVSGEGTKGSDGTLPIFVNCQAGVTFPASQQWMFYAKNVNFTFSSAVNGPGFTIDTCDGTYIIFDCCVTVYQPGTPGGTSFAFLLSPTNPAPADRFVAIADSKLWLGTIATPATGSIQAVIGLNISLGGCLNNFIGALEVNGTGTGTTPNAQCAFLAFGAASNTSFEQNIIDFSGPHLYSSAGIQIGVSTANASNYRQNIWRIGGLRGGNGSTGISTYGSYDQFYVGCITNEEGAFSVGINAQSTAVKNKFCVGQILNPGVAAIVNALNSNLNKFECQDVVPTAKESILSPGASGTFTCQPWTRELRVRMAGGGASGNGGGTGGSNGTAGSATTFGGLTANGGAISAGGGGNATGGDWSVTGGIAGAGWAAVASVPGIGGPGGASFFGGAGNGIANGNGTTATGFGSGGAGGGSNVGTIAGTGGSAGAYQEKLYLGPSNTYNYSVAGPTFGGAAGTNGQNGGGSPGGIIILEERP